MLLIFFLQAGLWIVHVYNVEDEGRSGLRTDALLWKNDYREDKAA